MNLNKNKANIISLALKLRMEKSVMANGFITKLKMKMEIAKLALKNKTKNLKKLKWIKTDIILMIARLKVVKKV